ncbi:M16 family metallopeptidase [Aestuariimicrobium soli]|uniref:M16 family metallopeptidase n=1 Tax=Aestuariimicrobium soli TaxID=2035834 RepID=UPI003EBCD370
MTATQPSITAPRDPRHVRPGVLSANPWLFPTPEIARLDNGLEVWAYRLPGQHVIALDLTLDVHLSVEPRELEGVATMTLRTSDEGGLDHPGARLAEALESAGAVYDGAINHQFTGCSLDAPATRIDTALDLFREILTRPEHHPADLNRHVALRLAEIEQGRASGPATASRATRQVVWGREQRRGRPSGGDAHTLGRLTRDHLAEFHQRTWRPDVARIVIAGDHPDLIGQVARGLGGWARPDVEAVTSLESPVALPAGGARVVHLVDRPEAVQADVRISGIGLSRRDRDLPALQLAGVAVGGSFLSRLNKRIREELGYTYGISFGHQPNPTTPRWQVSTSVRTEVVAAALDETQTLLDLTTHGLTDRELADARAQLVTMAPLRYETASAIVGQAASLAVDRLDVDWINRHFARMSAIDPDEATEVFSRVVAADRHQVVVVGPADTLAPDLEARGFRVVSHDVEE